MPGVRGRSPRGTYPRRRRPGFHSIRLSLARRLRRLRPRCGISLREKTIKGRVDLIDQPFRPTVLRVQAATLQRAIQEQRRDAEPLDQVLATVSRDLPVTIRVFEWEAA